MRSDLLARRPVTLHPSDLDLQRIAFEHHHQFDLRIQNHVDACDRCASTVRYMRALRDAIRREGEAKEAEGPPLPSIALLLRARVDEHTTD